MPYETEDQRRKKKELALVPPPPPYQPAIPAGSFAAPSPVQIGQALSAPVLPISAAPPTPFIPGMSPALPQVPQLSAIPINPQDLANYRSAVTDLGTQADAAKSRLADIGNQMVSVPTPEPSGFEQMMTQGLQERVQKLLSDKDDALTRFNKGFDLGQKLASNIVVPLMGSLSHRAGSAMGYAAAGDRMRQISAEADARRIAERHANNAAISNLAQIYESLDPGSAKNLTALAGHRLRADELNRQAQAQAQKDALEAASKYEGAQKNLLDFQRTGTEKENKQALDLFNAGVNRAKAISEEQNRVGAAQDREKRLPLEERRVTAEEQRLKDEADRGVEAKIDRRTANQMKAQEQVALRMRQLRQDLDATNATGMKKYPNAQEYFKNNPAEIQALSMLMKEAGLSTSAEDMIKSEFERAKPTVAPAASGSPLDWIGGALRSLQPKMDVIPETPGQAVPPKAGPTGKMSALQAAHDSFVAKNGRQPTPDELAKLVGAK